MAASHASGPCQNHRGSALMAAAIFRLTSPETASCRQSPRGLAADTPWSQRPAPHSDAFGPTALPRHGSQRARPAPALHADTPERLRAILAFFCRGVLHREVVSNPVEQFREVCGAIDAASERYVSVISAGLAENNRHLNIFAECQRDDRAGEFYGLFLTLASGHWASPTAALRPATPARSQN